MINIYVILTGLMSEFNEFKSRLKSPQNRF